MLSPQAWSNLYGGGGGGGKRRDEDEDDGGGFDDWLGFVGISLGGR